jgi:hypothetical protein
MKLIFEIETVYNGWNVKINLLEFYLLELYYKLNQMKNNFY